MVDSIRYITNGFAAWIGINLRDRLNCEITQVKYFWSGYRQLSSMGMRIRSETISIYDPDRLAGFFCHHTHFFLHADTS